MSGISGIVNFKKRPVDLEILKKINNAQVHRGPDDESILIEDNVGFCLRQLNIKNLATKYQPIHNENKQVWVICDGEIYNFLELREELQDNFHRFYTRSNAEVIVHLYEDLGEDFLAKLNGMFALALWDKRHQKLILARDRMGQKALHFSLLPDKLIFASEIKSILQHPDINKSLDAKSISKYFTYEFVPAPHTIFNQIKKLLPGHKLILEKEKIRIEKYWDITFSTEHKELKDERLVAEELDGMLRESVRKRLIGEVELGAFLSGGLDSSYIVSLMADFCPGRIKTFSIGFEDKSFDESAYARSVARDLNTQHFEEVLTSRQLLDLIPKICDFLDEPLGDASIIPTYLLSSFTRQHVTVALSGDGGDELFAGYPTYFAHTLARLYLKAPSMFRKKLNKLADKLPVSLNNFSLDFKIKKFISGLGYNPEIRHYIWLGSFSPAQKEELFCDDFKQHLNKIDNFEDIEFHLKNCNSNNFLEKLLYLDARLYLQDDGLVKMDRASTANSLEVRSPFLDPDVVEFAAKLPHTFKLNKFKSKYILKKAATRRLPSRIINRTKKGFGMPIAKWINGELKPFVLDTLSSSKLKKQHIFNYIFIEKLLNEHFSKKKDNRKLIWTLLVFQMWYKKYILNS